MEDSTAKLSKLVSDMKVCEGRNSKMNVGENKMTRFNTLDGCDALPLRLNASEFENKVSLSI